MIEQINIPKLVKQVQANIWDRGMSSMTPDEIQKATRMNLLVYFQKLYEPAGCKVSFMETETRQNFVTFSVDPPPITRYIEIELSGD